MFEFIVDTDDDFGLEFNGVQYFYHEIRLELNSVDDLDKIKVLARDGGPITSATKCSEYFDGIAEIKKNPNEYFNSRGGNRGVEWGNINFAL